jgi:hypothetical protein
MPCYFLGGIFLNASWAIGDIAGQRYIGYPPELPFTPT